MEKNDFEKAISLAYFYLKFRARTVREMERYLEQRAQKYRFSPEVIPRVLQELINQKYLDDAKFVKMYVHDRMKFKPRSVFLLKKELAKLGISSSLLESFFEESPVDDLTAAVLLLKKKILSFSRLAPRDRFAKSVRYLQSRGFTYGESKDAIKSLENGNG